MAAAHRLYKFSNQNNFARASHFFVHFSAVTARLRRENAQLHVVQRKYTSDDEISSLFLNLDMVLWNSTLGGFTYICKLKVSDLGQSQWRLKEREFTFSATLTGIKVPNKSTSTT